MTLSDLQEELKMSLTVAKGSFFKRPEFGHRFKELTNETANERTRSRAETYAGEAVQWMLDLGHVNSVSVAAYYDDQNRLRVQADLTAPSGKSVSFSRFVEVSDVSSNS